MRTIKFKVYHNNKLIGYEKCTKDGWSWMCPELNPDSGWERWTPGMVFPSHLSKGYFRMQWTGEVDSKGSEIYEGDILTGPFATGMGGKSTRYKDKKVTVKWGQARFYPDPLEELGNYRWFPSLNECKVIGSKFSK